MYDIYLSLLDTMLQYHDISTNTLLTTKTKITVLV